MCYYAAFHGKILYLTDKHSVLYQSTDIAYNEGFGFINNINITSQYLWKDGLHLIESGKVILANNFIHSINNLL